ncbi:hypothetical protein BU14_0176s0003 [Porphyra umbilicalis]|uniref:Uncharacterized protein n=1 Tax=Porphyra umbilicalis TaxID=2786 RepID=A0A1X6P797_PORUM|nr:hypothetical protein BU14_0176s0003 [Porphyra umbilicalis]|eukprot:OSX76761.1 hypothetical protein BU14_0176s0003 [Porphyra umbilicalis]
MAAVLAAHSAAAVRALPPPCLRPWRRARPPPPPSGGSSTFTAGAGASAAPPARGRRLRLAVGGGTKVAAEVRQRGDAFWAQADFVASDVALELVGDALLVWLLSPALPMGGGGGGGGASHLASVWDNSVAWGAFLGLSSNPRYQLVSAVEQRFVDGWLRRAAGGGGAAELAAAAVSTALRLGNCYTGSSQWIPFARMVGVQ